MEKALITEKMRYPEFKEIMLEEYFFWVDGKRFGVLMAHFDGEVFDNPRRVVNPQILVDSNLLQRHDFSELFMEAIVEHVLRGLWLYCKPGFSLSPRPSWISRRGRRRWPMQ